MDPFIGQVMIFAGNFPPRGWAACNGQLLNINQNQSLFSILGTTYGGDGRTTFGLPDLRGRVPMHAGTGPGLTNRKWGEKLGEEKVTLSEAQMPVHNHPVACHDGRGNADTPKGNLLAGASDTFEASGSDQMEAQMVGNKGGGQAHDNMQPSLTFTICIALVGIYPSRN